MDQHTIYIISIIIIIAIFSLVIFAICYYNRKMDLFKNVGMDTNMNTNTNMNMNMKDHHQDHWIDTFVPGNLRFKCDRNIPNKKGTPLVSVTKIKTAREPIVLEEPFMWYSTQ